jgi:hypothetical protein
VGTSMVRIFHASAVVAEHRRCFEPHGQVIDLAHFDGLWRRSRPMVAGTQSPLAALGRSLADYERAVEGEP